MGFYLLWPELLISQSFWALSLARLLHFTSADKGLKSSPWIPTCSWKESCHLLPHFSDARHVSGKQLFCEWMNSYIFALQQMLLPLGAFPWIAERQFVKGKQDNRTCQKSLSNIKMHVKTMKNPCSLGPSTALVWKHLQNLQFKVSPFEEHQRSQEKKKNPSQNFLTRVLQWILRTRMKDLVILGTEPRRFF